MWPVDSKYIKVLMFEFIHMPIAYQNARMWTNQLFAVNLPFMIKKYGTRQIWLPHTQVVGKLLAQYIRKYKALHMDLIAVEDPWAYPLYAASKRSEPIFNYHAKSPVDVDREIKGLHPTAPFLCLEDNRIDWGVRNFTIEVESYQPKTKGRTRQASSN